MVLNLDSDFKPFHAEKEIKFEAFHFAGGEPHIRISTEFKADEEILITHRVRQFQDVGILLTAVNALRKLGVSKMSLLLPYFPGSRQDRVMNYGEALTVQVYADIINAQVFRKVIILDPHSDVTTALVSNCEIIDPHLFAKQVIDKIGSDVCLISPDSGALKNIYSIAKALNKNTVVECTKHRDIQTGHLSGFKVHVEDLQGKDCLILDDICDGGGTFIGLAKELKNKNAGKIYLGVSHGIFSKGLSVLKDSIEKIYTTNSFYDSTDDDFVEVTPISTLLK